MSCICCFFQYVHVLVLLYARRSSSRFFRNILHMFFPSRCSYSSSPCCRCRLYTVLRITMFRRSSHTRTAPADSWNVTAAHRDSFCGLVAPRRRRACACHAPPARSRLCGITSASVSGAACATSTRWRRVRARRTVTSSVSADKDTTT